MSVEPKRHNLRLLIEVPGLYAEDLVDLAAQCECEIIDILNEEMRSEVGLTIVTLPGEKCGNDDFEVTVHIGHIVGAEVVKIP